MQHRSKRLIQVALAGVGLVALAALGAACSGSVGEAAVSNTDTGIDTATPTPAADAHQDPEGDELALTVTTEKVAFHPAQIRVKAGQTVRLTLENLDPVLHDFTSEEGGFVILESSGAQHDMHDEDTDTPEADGDAHDGAADSKMTMKLHVAADANSEAVLVFQAPEPGEYVVYCTVPGHRLAGMEGRIIVEP